MITLSRPSYAAASTSRWTAALGLVARAPAQTRARVAAWPVRDATAGTRSGHELYLTSTVPPPEPASSCCRPSSATYVPATSSRVDPTVAGGVLWTRAAEQHPAHRALQQLLPDVLAAAEGRDDDQLLDQAFALISACCRRGRTSRIHRRRADALYGDGLIELLDPAGIACPAAAVHVLSNGRRFATSASPPASARRQPD